MAYNSQKLKCAGIYWYVCLFIRTPWITLNQSEQYSFHRK